MDSLAQQQSLGHLNVNVRYYNNALAQLNDCIEGLLPSGPDLTICLKKISPVGKDEVDEWEFFKLKIKSIIVFVFINQYILPSWASASTYCAIFIRKLSISLFSFVNKVDFSCQ